MNVVSRRTRRSNQIPYPPCACAAAESAAGAAAGAASANQTFHLHSTAAAAAAAAVAAEMHTLMVCAVASSVVARPRSVPGGHQEWHVSGTAADGSWLGLTCLDGTEGAAAGRRRVPVGLDDLDSEQKLKTTQVVYPAAAHTRGQDMNAVVGGNADVDAAATVAVGSLESAAPSDAPTAVIEIARQPPRMDAGVVVVVVVVDVVAASGTASWPQVSWVAEMPSTPLWRNSATNLGTRFPPNGALRSGLAAAALV
jgi:hypothetical protein